VRWLISNKVPNLVFLMETKKEMIVLHTLNNCGGLGNAFGVDCIGEGNRRVRGLYLMWNDKITHSGYNFFLSQPW